MYSKLPNLVIGFHGCSKKTYENVLFDHQQLTKSTNTYDWLGNGMYFWENNYQGAFEWARQHHSDPQVIGAVIDLGNCLNLTDNKSIEIVQNGYELLKAHLTSLNKKLPVNRNVGKNKDLLIRDLDCAVIQQIHSYNLMVNKPPFDSVRGVFLEGDEIYPNSGFKNNTHIQICVVNPNCIKGYFNPLVQNEEYPMP